MLRVVFGPDDLARVRVAAGPDRMWEIANSVQTLQRRDGARAFGDWRGAVRARLSRESRRLASLLPPRGYSPDFLTPTVTSATSPAAAAAVEATGEDSGKGFDAAVDAVLSTPRTRLAAELRRLAAERETPGWMGALARGDAEALRALGAAIRAYQAEAVAPYWPRVRAHVEADRVDRLRALLDGGVDGLLAGLGPQMRWRPPVLEVAYPVRQTLRLEGRGLVLQPSFFCWPAPVSLADAGLPPVLVYPVRHDAARPSGADDARTARDAALSALLGPVRAAVLVAACTGCGTGETARRLGVSNPAVSQHVAVLRGAGLLITVRDAGRTLHVATPQGRALVRSAGVGTLQ
ncbi:ArsR/SmtB family transcription factor [Streptomyces varsoviensis]|uniref:ArsR/SmtB family transcription factor n=1 Tax=Streptomyces varsoviensis TaxID=67373 RepID=UPI0004CBE933|nr:winged helix-turn-helix domain-containing protein [Streptomyces varsoviensis]